MLKRFYDHCEPDYKYTVSDTVELVNAEDWQSLGTDNLYLDIPYLTAMEQGMDDFDYRYVIAYNKQLQPILKAYIQVVNLKGLDKGNSQWIYDRFGKSVVQKILPDFQIRIVVCGNLFVCGENGFEHSPLIDRSEASKVLSEALQRVAKSLDDSGKPSLILIKELFPENDPSLEAFKDERYYPFQIDCNMILPLQSEWQNMDQYYSSMTSKFRTKAKSIHRKSADLDIVHLNSKEIGQYSEEIDRLHQNVLANSEFTLGALNASTLEAMKQQLGDQMIFTTYKLKEKWVGFSVAFLGADFVDAAHVGLDYDFNVDYAVYQRMLHEFVKLGISEKKDEIRFGRTAEQIKSSLGGEPVYMRLYIKHRNSLINHLIKPIVDQIKPRAFQQRSPFKLVTTE